MTAAPRAPTTARSSPTATCTAPDPPAPARTRAAGPHRHPDRAGPRRPDRRAGPVQARPPHRRRPRRLPPRPVPRRHGQDPLPPPPRINAAGPGPARDPHPARTPPGLLHPADHHRPAGRAHRPAQKHDYPSAAWRRSYTRRTGAERGFASAKDPATNDISRGWCRLMGLTPLMLFTTTLLIVRNQRILAAWNARQQDNQHRAAKGLPPKTRQHRRKIPPAPPQSPPCRHKRPAAPRQAPPPPQPQAPRTKQAARNPRTQPASPRTGINPARTATPTK